MLTKDNMSIKFLKNPIVIVSIASVVALSIGAYAYFNGHQKTNNNGLVVKRMDLSEEVSST